LTLHTLRIRAKKGARPLHIKRRLLLCFSIRRKCRHEFTDAESDMYLARTLPRSKRWCCRPAVFIGLCTGEKRLIYKCLIKRLNFKNLNAVSEKSKKTVLGTHSGVGTHERPLRCCPSKKSHIRDNCLARPGLLQGANALCSAVASSPGHRCRCTRAQRFSKARVPNKKKGQKRTSVAN